ncbi:hypothetical protein QBC41DRAFT_305212 [Cercophora samala]|uniref:Uncharacterized protein n=1 Tax=Cercophora samala TaxID=330535 RepID=A0AA40D853_9PEZI|nr:hypothetical protein QBC41DRAFT_305212 [Cercophora samala]
MTLLSSSYHFLLRQEVRNCDLNHKRPFCLFGDEVQPIFQGTVKSALSGSRESSHLKDGEMEKYGYEASTKSIASYIRLLPFELHEAVYDAIHGGKGAGSESRGSANLSLYLYEAVLEAALWDRFSAALHDDETDLLLDYVRDQTINVHKRQ